MPLSLALIALFLAGGRSSFAAASMESSATSTQAPFQQNALNLSTYAFSHPSFLSPSSIEAFIDSYHKASHQAATIPAYDLGRDSRGISAVNFRGMPLEILFDFQSGEFNVSLLEDLIHQAADHMSTALQQTNGRPVIVEADLIGQMRTLRSGKSQDITILFGKRDGWPDSEARRIEFTHNINTLLQSFPMHAELTPFQKTADRGIYEATLLLSNGSVEKKTRVELRYRYQLTIPDSGQEATLANVQHFIEAEYYLGDDERFFQLVLKDYHWAFNPYSDPEAPFKFWRGLASRRLIIEERLHQWRQEYGNGPLSRLVLQRISGPVIPYDGARGPDRRESAEHDQLEQAAWKAYSMIRETNDFYGKSATLELLKQLLGSRRIYYARHLPGSFRAQYQQDFSEIVILVNHNFQFLFDERGTYWKQRSAEERKGLITFLAAHLIHEATEILMADHPSVDWQRGNLDRNMANSESVAYRMEKRFLEQHPEINDQFLPLLQGHPALESFFRAPQNPMEYASIWDLLRKLRITYNWNLDAVGELDRHVIQRAAQDLLTLDHYFLGKHNVGRNADAALPRVPEIPMDLRDRLRFDERMSAANTIRDFIDALPEGKESDALTRLLQSPLFARVWLEGGAQQKALDKNMRIDATMIDELNRRLKELSMRIHVENGSILSALAIHSARTPEGIDHLILEREVKPFTDSFLAIEPAWGVDFHQVVTGRERYVSAFEGTLRHIAIPTHNRDNVIATILELAGNFQRFGHTTSGLHLHIFDDSNDAAAADRRARILSLAAPLARQGITLHYFGDDERVRQKTIYKKALAQLSDPHVDRRRIKPSMETVLGTRRGVGIGAQRNWMMLQLGDENFAMIDDDIHPEIPVEMEGTTQIMPVDLLGELNRGLNHPDARAVSLEYVGHEDILLSDLLVKGDEQRWVTYNSQQPLHRPSGSEGGIHPPTLKTLPIGGVIAIASKRWGLGARVPTMVNQHAYFRAEDFTIGHVMAYIADPSLKREDPFIIWYPGGAVFHHKNERPALRQLPQGVIGEAFGKLLPSMFAWIRTGTMGDRASETWSSTPSASMHHLADEFVDLFKRTWVGPPIDVRDAAQSVLSGLLRMYRKPPSAWKESTEGTQKSIRDIFKSHGMNPEDPALRPETLATNDFVDRFEEEIYRFSDALHLWPSLVHVADQHKASSQRVKKAA